MAQHPTRSGGRMKRVIIIAAIVLLLLFLLLLIAIPFLIMPAFLGQRYEQQQYLSADYGIASERIALETSDSIPLAAWRTRAAEPKGTVIILSGIMNPSVTAFFGYAEMFADHGWDSLLIEMRARGESGGDEIGFGMTEWRDVQAGADFLLADERAGDLPIVALGTSMGGGTVLIATGECPEIDAVISLSGFSSWTDLFIDYMELSGVPRFVGSLDAPFVNLYLGFHFGFDALAYSPLRGIDRLDGRPLLLMHSTEDSQVPFSHFERLLAEATAQNANVTTFIREGDEHFICYEEYFDAPAGDTEFSEALLGFLDGLL